MKIRLVLVMICLFPPALTQKQEKRHREFHESFIGLEDEEKIDCDPLPSTSSNSWIVGDTRMHGLGSQLMGIYSYVPVALLYGVNLIVSGLYTKHTRQKSEDEDETFLTVSPFSAFFDWNHFSKYWDQRNITTLNIPNYLNCKNALPLTPIIRKHVDRAMPKEQLLSMLETANVSFPVPSNTVLHVEKGSASKLDPKFIRMYNFKYHRMEGLNLLLQVHESLKPAAPIQAYSEDILENLPLEFISAHFRLEAELFKFSPYDFENKLNQAIDHFGTNLCLSKIRVQSNIFLNAPALYIASGLFSDLTTASEVHVQRAKMLLGKLNKMGFKNIYTRDSILKHILEERRRTTESDNEKKETNFLDELPELEPDQEAWLDFQVARQSKCFVPAATPSPFSYMVLRNRRWDALLKDGESELKNTQNAFLYQMFILKEKLPKILVLLI